MDLESMERGGVVQNYGDVTLAELVDLSLCTPEVGAVNFNILRILLHEIVEKLGIDNLPAILGDAEAKQLEKYKTYAAGQQAGPGGFQGLDYGVQTLPLESPDSVPGPGALVQSTGVSSSPKPNMQGMSTNTTPRRSFVGTPVAGVGGAGASGQSGPEYRNRIGGVKIGGGRPQPINDKLEERLGKLEKTIDALTKISLSPEFGALEGDQVVTLQELGEQTSESPGGSPKQTTTTNNSDAGGGGGTSPNNNFNRQFLFQLVQLQNRIQNCEDSLEKMAGVLQKIGVDLHALKHDHKGFKHETRNIMDTQSKFNLKFPDLQDKCVIVQTALDALKSDLDGIQRQWQQDLDHLIGVCEEMDKRMTAQGMPKLFINPRKLKLSRNKSRDISSSKSRDKIGSKSREAISMETEGEGNEKLKPLDTEGSEYVIDKSFKKDAVDPSKSTKASMKTDRGTEIDDNDLRKAMKREQRDARRQQKKNAMMQLGDVAADLPELISKVENLWDAIQIVKTNEETLAVKILRQDGLLKKLPLDTLEKFKEISPENLQALLSGRPISQGGGATKNMGGFFSMGGEGRDPLDLNKSKLGLPASSVFVDVGDLSSMSQQEAIQYLFNQTGNLMEEVFSQKHRFESMLSQMDQLEVRFASKQMLMEALNDKADRGMLNTKVSYNEFGTIIDELNRALRDLTVQNVDNNDHWKEVTDNLVLTVGEKLDKSELLPLKSQIKGNMKALNDRVKTLAKQLEEPDPAGTRKKLLRDYNCISCDRHCNISGVTHGPRLPVLGPIMAAHATASKRAFDLHKLRLKKKFDHDCRDMLALERQMRSLGVLNPDGSVKKPEELPTVNRYHGGSHTNICNADFIKATRGLCRPGTTKTLTELCTEDFMEVEEEEVFHGVPDMFLSENSRAHVVSEAEMVEDARGKQTPSTSVRQEKSGRVEDEPPETLQMPLEHIEMAEEADNLMPSYVYVEE